MGLTLISVKYVKYAEMCIKVVWVAKNECGEVHTASPLPPLPPPQPKIQYEALIDDYLPYACLLILILVYTNMSDSRA